MRYYLDSSVPMLIRASADSWDVARWDPRCRVWIPIDRLWLLDRLHHYDADATAECRPAYFGVDIDLDEIDEARAREIMG